MGGTAVVLQSYCSQQRRPGRVPRFIGRGVSSSPYTVHLCLALGVRGPGIAELCSVASRVARETQPSYLISLIKATQRHRDQSSGTR